MKPKRSYPKASGTYDECGSPDIAIDAIAQWLPRYVWEPAWGEGLLAVSLVRRGFVVHGAQGSDFFQESWPNGAQAIVTNPPYSIKYKWIEACAQFGRSFALLLPLESLGAAALWDAAAGAAPCVRIVTPRLRYKMPYKGWEGTPQFSTAWFCWGMNMPTLSRWTQPKNRLSNGR